MKIHPAFSGKGPKGETEHQIREIILELMRPYNMHHVPSPEMPGICVKNFFLAEVDNRYVGASGYKMVTEKQGKTTLLATHQDYSGQGVGSALQKARIDRMKSLGAIEVITNADRPKSISWYKKQGYQEVGSLLKLHSFGWDGADRWTTLMLKI